MKLYKHAFILLAVVVLAGCGLGSAEKGRKPSPDWSRGLPLDSAVGGAYAMALSDTGDKVHFVWPVAGENELLYIHYMQLDQNAEVMAEHDLDLPLGKLFTPQLLPAGRGGVELFWVLRPAGSGDRQLWRVSLDEAGSISGTPEQISPADHQVGSFTAAASAAGDAVVWEDRNSGSLYGAILATTDDQGPETIVSTGSSPTLHLEKDGTLSFVWLQGASVYYASFPDGRLAPVEGTRVADFVQLQSDSIAGPVVGAAGDWVTVFWSIYSQTGEEGGTGRTEYVSFPVGAPVPSPTERIGIMTAEAPPYEPYQGSFPLSQMVPGPIPVNMSSDYIFGPSVVSGKGSEMLVALSAVQQMRMDQYIQIAVVLFDQGQPAGYQVASKTDSFSQEAILAADANGDLHLSWRDGSGGRKLYYASTADATQGAIDSLSGDDVASAALAGLMEAAAGILFFPLALGWLLPGVLLLGIWKLKKEDAGMSHPVTLLMFVVSLILYQVVKLLFLPTILSYTPFSAWIDFSEALGAVLRLAVPISTLAAGVLSAEWIRRRRGDATAFFYFIVVCGVDAFLTLAVYGVNFMGVF